jgi:hypothetical protein
MEGYGFTSPAVTGCSGCSGFIRLDSEEGTSETKAQLLDPQMEHYLDVNPH